MLSDMHLLKPRPINLASGPLQGLNCYTRFRSSRRACYRSL